MAWTAANPVVIGGATKKSDYDTLFANATHLRDEAVTLSGVKTFTDMTKFSRGVQVASAADLRVDTNADGIYFNVTGTTTITSIHTLGATGTGAAKGILPLVVLNFDGILTLTHSASLILPGAANITTYAGLVLTFVEESAAVWRCTGYTIFKRASRASRQTTQAIASGVGWTKVQINTVDYDDLSGLDIATNYRFTARVPGTYVVNAGIQFGVIAAGYHMRVGIYKNGAKHSMGGWIANPATDARASTVSDILQLAVNDTVELYAYHDDTVSRNVGDAGGGANFISIGLL